MSYDLQGKVALVTGASAGIGEATARKLAGRGARVVLAARRGDRLEALAAELGAAGTEALAVPCDVSLAADNQRLVRAAVARFGTVDVAVLNAGRGNAASVEDTTEAMLESLFRLNVFSLYHAARALLPRMKAQRSGRIVTVASVAGKLGMPYMNAYAAAKHAAVGFSNTLRLELLGTGVEATVVLPAAVATEWSTATEGGSLGELVARSIPRARELARELGIRGGGSGVLTAEQVADAILAAIEDPVPEVYTHAGTHDQAIEAVTDRAAAERKATPLALAMQETYAAGSVGGGSGAG
ncbi:MAG: SDR family NAD(P)-dependent oxidoreductase [Deltaproteobacteria bacterium]|nr:SDR family NAD(P)-dependent oxidoreductase [Deltaproteobacteria bacterium]